jgi:hypothetical protein
MATRLVSVPTVPGAAGSRSAVALSVGLAALSMSFALFLFGVMLAEPRLHPIDVLVGAGNRVGAGQDAAGRDVTRTSQSVSRLAPVVDWSAADLRSPALTTANRTQAESRGPVWSRPGSRSPSGSAANALDAAAARGTRGESAHGVATPLRPDRRDRRWDILEMAAAQHRDWTKRCPCPIYASDTPGRGPR